jgi:hypothetical protein
MPLGGKDPCARTGPLAATYWVDLGRNIWHWVSAELAPLFRRGAE